MTMSYTVYRSNPADNGLREAVECFTTLAEAKSYVRSHAVDEHGNLSHEVECDYLWIADVSGETIEA